MKRRCWPTDEELERLQQLEYDLAEQYGDDADPICCCGEPGWMCRCDELAKKIGYYNDGTPYKDHA
jgi:hypothetical protein